MKQFFACTAVRNLNASKAVKEWVEYDINTLIRDEAEMILNSMEVNMDDSIDIVSDEEWDAMVAKKAKEIKDELMYYGIYNDQFGQPLFLYC